jgi:hypothetical protein
MGHGLAAQPNHGGGPPVVAGGKILG